MGDGCADTVESGAMKDVVILDKVSKKYGDVTAVDGIVLHVRPGELLTLLGPSGSGKTTTLMMIAGLLFPTSGRILMGDEDITFKPPEMRNMGVVFQHYALFPHMSVFENVAFALRARGMAREEIQKRVVAAFRMTQLSGFERRAPHELSGGQQQRVALARALVFRPQVLLMDEPLGALDRKLRIQMQLEIKQIQRLLGIAIVHVTHDQEEALVMSDRVVVLAEGKVRQEGTARNVYDRPADRFVADFLGEANILEGEIVEASLDTCTVQVSGTVRVKVRTDRRLEKGQRTSLCLRPERVVLAGELCREWNAFDAKVRSLRYQGDVTRYLLEVGDGLTIHGKAVNGFGSDHLTVGSELKVGWRCEDAWVLPET
jgi:spermidine/putrescine ABC transporter ATP-binding subunit